MSHTGNYDIESQVGHHLHHRAGGSLKSNSSTGRTGYQVSPLTNTHRETGESLFAETICLICTHAEVGISEVQRKREREREWEKQTHTHSKEAEGKRGRQAGSGGWESESELRSFIFCQSPFFAALAIEKSTGWRRASGKRQPSKRVMHRTHLWETRVQITRLAWSGLHSAR